MFLSVLLFCRRRFTALYAFSVSLLAFYACSAYALEGCAYGVVLGGAAAALLFWQMAAEGQRRAYAIFILGPLFLAEIIRASETGKFDYPILAGMGSAVLVLALHYPLIATSREFQS